MIADAIDRSCRRMHGTSSKVARYTVSIRASDIETSASRRLNVYGIRRDRMHVVEFSIREWSVSVEKLRDAYLTKPHDKCLEFGCAFREKQKTEHTESESNLSSR